MDDEQKVKPTSLISTTNSQTDGNGIGPRSGRTRLIPGSIAFLVFLGIAALYVSATHLLNRATVSMARPHTNDISILPITVSLSPLAAPQDASADARPSFRLNVTLTNTGEVTLVILKWQTPFAHGAPAMGIFKVTDLRWGTAVPDMGLMIDYLFPEDDTFVLQKGDYSSDDLLLIKPGESVSEEVKIGDPEVLVKGGNKYSVKAKGRWMAVWMGEDENGRYAMKDSIGNGYFESEMVEVQT
ncbi:hypothetical protein V502_01626 [Pseudogymnoascus sp. VKM F-4520 (FW-2644)]|nr:hypothetical protein V502_01626 [Pseudogymnoascus sp. VKM F-4520 (FW-2644)]